MDARIGIARCGRLWVVIVAMTLAACMPVMKPSAGFVMRSDLPITVVDTRPPAEKTRDIGSLLITSCAYGVQRAGDKVADPAPIRYLQNYINTVFQAQPGDQVVVHRLEIYYNIQIYLRRGVNRQYSGLIPALIERAECAQKTSMPGWVDYTHEDPTGARAVVVYLDADFRGQRHTARAVALADPSSKGAHGMPVFKALDEAFREAFPRGKGAAVKRHPVSRIKATPTFTHPGSG